LAGACAAACVVFSSAPAAAQSAGDTSFTIKIAVDLSIGGLMHPSATGVLGGAPAVINESKWTDTHSERAPLFVAGLGVSVAPAAEVLANFEYGRVGSDSRELGTVGDVPLVGAFDKYQFWGLETGVRAGRLQGTGAFGIATVGFRRVNQIDGTFAADGQFAFTSFYASSTVPTFGFGGGMMFGDYDFAIGVEVMVKYAGGLKAGTVNLEGTGLEGLNSRGERWSLPVSVAFRF
jgi:hypothetical protein